MLFFIIRPDLGSFLYALVSRSGFKTYSYDTFARFVGQPQASGKEVG